MSKSRQVKVRRASETRKSAVPAGLYELGLQLQHKHLIRFFTPGVKSAASPNVSVNLYIEIIAHPFFPETSKNRRHSFA